MHVLQTPLFWDLHLHGVGGHDFLYTKPSEILSICEVLGKQGLGFFAPTLLTSDKGDFKKALAVWGGVIEQFYNGQISSKKLPTQMALPIGIHCEGPFLNPEMAGAHPLKYLLKPSIGAFKEMFEASAHQIRILTIAPEMPGALEVIALANKLGVRVQLGHSNCTLKQALAAQKAGATGLTHLFNAMRFHHRDPGLFGLLTSMQNESNQITAEIILDGAHLDLDFASFCVHSLKDKIYAVSDSCSQKSLGNLKIESKDGVAYVAKTKIIAGSTLPLTSCTSQWSKKWSKKAENPTDFFELFYKTQNILFLQQFQKLKKQYPALCSQRLHFDPKSFAFLKRLK